MINRQWPKYKVGEIDSTFLITAVQRTPQTIITIVNSLNNKFINFENLLYSKISN